MNSLKYLAVLSVIRFLLVMFCMQNYDHADEYWQGP